MPKCGTIIKNLTEAGYHRTNINDVIRALFCEQVLNAVYSNK